MSILKKQILEYVSSDKLQDYILEVVYKHQKKERNRSIAVDYIYTDMTVNSIAKKHNLSTTRLNQILESALWSFLEKSKENK